MKNLINDEIKAALEALGVTGKATFRYITHDRVEVMVNGEYFGIWDAIRKTFVE